MVESALCPVVWTVNQIVVHEHGLEVANGSRQPRSHTAVVDAAATAAADFLGQTAQGKPTGVLEHFGIGHAYKPFGRNNPHFGRMSYTSILLM